MTNGVVSAQSWFLCSWSELSGLTIFLSVQGTTGEMNSFDNCFSKWVLFCLLGLYLSFWVFLCHWESWEILLSEDATFHRWNEKELNSTCLAIWEPFQLIWMCCWAPSSLFPFTSWTSFCEIAGRQIYLADIPAGVWDSDPDWLSNAPYWCRTCEFSNSCAGIQSLGILKDRTTSLGVRLYKSLEKKSLIILSM